MEQQILDKLYAKYLKSGSVTTDSRVIKDGDIFFALKGKNFDGNQYAKKAIDAGASMAVVDDPSTVNSERIVLVPDGLAALQELANHHRNQLNIPVIALTGSNGKTTTKELIRDVLATQYKVLATPGNFNNHIGVPLTLLQIDSDIEIAVIEMGANHVGEIASLCKIADPDHGMITNIGKAHIGTFGGFENILRGKTELYQHLIARNGTVWINGSDAILSNMAKRFKAPLIYLDKQGWYNAELLEADPFIRFKDESGKAYTTQLMGAYNFTNLVAALAIGKSFGVSPDLAAEAVCNYIPENNRSQIVKAGRGSNTIILDAYNANPTSMEEALKSFDGMNSDKKAVILGDMNELGDATDEEHENLCSRVAEINPEIVMMVGPLIKKSALNHNFSWFETADEVIDFLRKDPLGDALVLLKASRSIGLEKVMEAFK